MYYLTQLQKWLKYQLSGAKEIGVALISLTIAYTILLGGYGIITIDDRLDNADKTQLREIGKLIAVELETQEKLNSQINGLLQNIKNSIPTITHIHIYEIEKQQIKLLATTEAIADEEKSYLTEKTITLLQKNIITQQEEIKNNNLEIYLPVNIKKNNNFNQGILGIYGTLNNRDRDKSKTNQQILIMAGCSLAIQIICIVFVIYGNTWRNKIKIRPNTSGKLAETNINSINEKAREKSQEIVKFKEAEIYAIVAIEANDGLWNWNLKTNNFYFSPGWSSILGYDLQEIDNTLEVWLQRIHPEDINRIKTEINNYIQHNTGKLETEYRLLHKDGTYRWVLSRAVAIKDENHKTNSLSGCIIDITKYKKTEEQLLHDAFHDSLTGLSNRALFMNRLEHAFDLSRRRQNYLFAVLFVDLDRFKIVNDSLGHKWGDRLLIEFVERLVPCLRSGDTIGRIGGDEFAILLEDINYINDATAVAERLQKLLEEPFILNGQKVIISASIGIALSAVENYQHPEEIIRDADIAMYRAKAMGKARHQVFEPDMDFENLTFLQIENDLRQAIDNKEFQIQYQPIVSLSTGLIIGFEALVRWQHLTKGIISPAEFIPVAEQTGLIIPVGYWVLRSACRQMSIWQNSFPFEPPLTINVNLSGKQFFQADLLVQIISILEETGLKPNSLKLEITESAIIENPEAAATKLIQLKDLGVQLYIDDFGTGYSSLSFMHRFPFDALKIDTSFIGNMGADSESSEIVKSIVNLAHNLGIYVVAEGVETSSQLEKLKAMGCNNGQGQGYLFSKPLGAEDVEILLAETWEERKHQKESS